MDYSMNTRKQACIIFALLFCALFFNLFGTIDALAGQSAMDALLSICEQNGVVTPGQAREIRARHAREKEETTKRQQDFDQKLKALILWEKELAARQEALVEWEQALPTPERSDQAPYAPPAGVFPTEEALEAMAEFPGENTVLLSALLDDQKPESPNKVWYRDGFCIGDSSYSYLRFGALLQTDYWFVEHEDALTAEDRFDIRRARLILSGRLLKEFGYRFSYEFSGAGSRNLLDAYADVRFFDWMGLRLGQGKEPYGLEQSSSDRNLWFSQRSMGNALAPGRDVGLMAFGSAWRSRVHYGAGVFNGDGMDDESGGHVDDLQFTARLAISPFKNTGFTLLDNLHLGGSVAYGRIDRTNVDIQVLSAGGTEFFEITSGAKFHIIYEADHLKRNGLEFGWAHGPMALCGEYFHQVYTDVETQNNIFDVDLKDYYLAALVMLTGEEPGFKKGRIAPIAPLKGITHDGWGAIGLAFRFDDFHAPASLYDDLIEAGESVRHARAWTFALNWYPEARARLMLDYSRTYFDKPLKVGRDPILGTAEYTDREDTVRGRFQLGF